MNSNFQFISYTPTPTDQYMLGIAKIKLYGKIELRYKHVKTKDGSGSFFTSATYSMVDPNTQEKKYVPCFLIDSRSDEEEIQDIIRDGMNRVLKQKSVHQPESQEINYPHGLVKAAPYPANPPISKKEVAVEEEIPF